MTYKMRGFNLSNAVASGAFALAVAGLAATTVNAQELRYAVGLPEANYNFDGAVAFADELKETADLDVKVFGMSLLSLGELSGGIRDGLADFGFTLFPYFPAEYSELNLAADLGMLSTSGSEAKYPGAAMIGASMEYIMLNCPDCQAQLNGLNQVYLSGGAAINFGLACNKPVATTADLEGTRVRTGAADAGRFVEHFGGVRVAISGNEIYDALSTGNVDCSAVTPANLIDLRLIEVTDYFVNRLPGSMFAGIGSANMNHDTWAGLTEDQRRAVMHASATLALTSVSLLEANSVTALEEFEAAGKTVFQVTDADKELVTDFVAQDQPIVRQQYIDNYGISNVDEKIAAISALIEKWKGLTNQTDGSIEAVRALYVDEIFANIDVSTYGLN